MSNIIQTKKIVFVGDRHVGKTSLLYALHNGRQPTAEELRMFPCYSVSLEYPSTILELPSFSGYSSVFNDTPTIDTPITKESSSVFLVDTASAEDYGRLRSYSYRDCHVIAICFSIGSMKSLRNVLDRWQPELLLFAPDKPTLLVGCKLETRTSKNGKKTVQVKDNEGEVSDEEMVDCVSPEEGRKMAKRIKAIGYLECSAKQGINIEELNNILHWSSVMLQDGSSPDRPQNVCMIG